MEKCLFLVITMAFIVVFAAACSMKGGVVKERAAEEEKDSKTPKEPVEIVFYAANGDAEKSFNALFGDAIRKKFPNHQISFIVNGKGTTIPELVASGTRIDMTYAGIGSYEINTIPYGLEYDLTELLKKHKIDLNRFEPSTIEAIRQLNNGKIYSVPVYGNNLVLYYNKSIFDKFGVKYPRDGMTWEETMELSRLLTRMDNGVQYFGFGMTANLTARFNPLSISVADVKTHSPTINKDDRWKRFFQTFFVDPLPAPGAVNKIPNNTSFAKDQNVAMFAYISSLITIWEEELKQLDWDIVSLPSFANMPGVGSQINSTNFGITSIAKDKDAAAEILAYLVSDEFQMSQSRKGTMPVLKSEAVRSVLGQDSVFKDKNFPAIFGNKPAVVPPKAHYDLDLLTIYAKYGTEVWLGKMDINTALRQAEEEAQKKIDDFLRDNSKFYK